MYLSRLIIYSTCVWLSSGFPAECLHRGVLQAVRDRKCTVTSVSVAPEKGTNMERMAEEKVNLAFLIYFPYSYCFFFKYPLHCVPLIWVSWGTFCLTDVIVCLCLSCVCGIYESQPGSSVIFLSGWRFERFRTQQRGEQGWQAASWNLSAFSFLLRCVFCDGRWDKGSGVCSSGAAVLPGRWSLTKVYGRCRKNGRNGSTCLVKYPNCSSLVCYLRLSHVDVIDNTHCAW